YGIWIFRAQRESAHTAFALKGVKFLDDRVANPAYGVLLITGLLMMWAASIPLTTLWIDIALALFVALVVVPARLYTPTLLRQIKLVETGDTSYAGFTQLARRGQMLGQASGVMGLAMLVLWVC